MGSSGYLLGRRVQQRVRDKLTTDQCVYHLNAAINFVSLQASCPWDQATLLNQVPVSDTVTISGLDVGKKIAVFNSTLKTPITRATTDEIAIRSQGFIGVMPSQYNAFRLIYSPSGSPMVDLWPRSAATNVDIYYHMTPLVLLNSTLSLTRWDIQGLDDFIVDYAEAEIKREFGAPDADTLMARCLQRLPMILGTFSDEKINTGPPPETEQARNEKNNAGIV